jgi:hypothetical protein
MDASSVGKLTDRFRASGQATPKVAGIARCSRTSAAIRAELLGRMARRRFFCDENMVDYFL